MNEVQSNINLKIERAERHIRYLERRIECLRTENPYSVTIHKNAETGESFFARIRAVKKLPKTISVVAGESVYQLRSSLDHMIWGMSRKNPKRSFPIYETAAEYKKSGHAKIKGLSRRCQDAVNRIEPYGDGKGRMLWILNRLSNFDKHNLMFVAAFGIGSFSLRYKNKPIQSAIRFPHKMTVDFSGISSSPLWMPEKKGKFIDVPIFRGVDPNVYVDAKLPFDVAFRKPEVAEFHSVVKLLKGCADAVKMTLVALLPFIRHYHG